MQRGFKVARPSISRVLSCDGHLSSHTVARMIKRFNRLVFKCADHIYALGRSHKPPCSKQGLPLGYVTIAYCGLLPHSFHPYLAKTRRYRFCGTFPRVTPGCR